MQARSNHDRRLRLRNFLRALIGIARLSVIPALATPVLANDTMAVIGAGGLQFAKSDELKMEREDLYLSTAQVRVKYIFRNLTDHDVTTTIAFPIPDLNMGELSEDPHQFHAAGIEGDIVDFHIRVDGNDVKPYLTVQAFNSDGRDVTALLHAHKIPITNLKNGEEDYTDGDVWQAIHLLKPDEVKDLIAAHAIDEDGEHPSWIARSAYHWQQTFPARTTLAVEHWYKPILGGGLLTADGPIGDYRYKQSDPWCTDTTFRNAMRKLAGTNPYLRGNWIEYILKTGANWAGPIGHFRLELDKGNAALLSTCPIPGLSLDKQGNIFVAQADNFTPTTDLKILLLNREKSP